MNNSAVARLRDLLPPPLSGGDAVDWQEVERTANLVFPADYREFVESYGGGEINEYLSISTPPVPGSAYGDLLDRVDPAVSNLEELAALLPAGSMLPLLPFADSASADVAFWLCEGVPDDWRVAVFRRQTSYGVNRWTVFDGGMASFLVAALTDEINPFSERLSAGDRHQFVKWQAL
ncbi:SMI1/KNR4 family protein [Streptomyces tritici]|uniref:SMI1/KNR4 family protein n=1 Tax=Streptomyces tritici TaxID=2054410 RepID=UPI003AF1E221